jgi:hypothetical protein
MKPRHPGKIDFYENRNGKEILTHTDKIENIPDNFRFIQIDNDWIPIVKVVAIMDDKGRPREITEYGPGGQRLRNTYAAPYR